MPATAKEDCMIYRPYASRVFKSISMKGEQLMILKPLPRNADNFFATSFVMKGTPARSIRMDLSLLVPWRDKISSSSGQETASSVPSSLSLSICPLSKFSLILST